MAKQTRNHYVPEFYLKNFTDNNEHIHVLSKKEKKIFNTTVKNICLENNLYNIEECSEIENLFSKIEGWAKLALNEVIINKKLTSSNINYLSYFFATLYYRNKNHFQNLQSQITNLIPSMEYMPEIQKHYFMLQNIFPIMKDIIPIIRSKKWIIIPSFNISFITCDAPFTVYNMTESPFGICSKGSVSFIPLNSKLCLLIGYNEDNLFKTLIDKLKNGHKISAEYWDKHIVELLNMIIYDNEFANFVLSDNKENLEKILK